MWGNLAGCGGRRAEAGQASGGGAGEQSGEQGRPHAADDHSGTVSPQSNGRNRATPNSLGSHYAHTNSMFMPLPQIKSRRAGVSNRAFLRTAGDPPSQPEKPVHRAGGRGTLWSLQCPGWYKPRFRVPDPECLTPNP